MGMHSKTPTLSVSDPRGLPIRTVDYWRAEYPGAAQTLVHRTFHDAAGRAVDQWDPRLWALQMSDPLTPASLAMVYLLNGQVLRSDSVDAGTQVALHGLGAQVLLECDSRGTRREIRHDSLLRPVAVFEEGESQPQRCVERFVYGQPGAGEPSRNQLGQLIRHDDPAGSVLFEHFAISGQCTENTRHFMQNLVTPDWPEPIDERMKLLEPGEGATSQWHFGPLGQVLRQVDARNNHQGIELTLDGRLRASYLQLKHQSEPQTLVSDIRYNADGKVTQERAGNRVLTTLRYRAEDGRLQVRQAENSDGEILQHLIYDYDLTGNVLSIEDKALPIRYFANQRIDPISLFIYDSRYQLREATGWEAGAASQGPATPGRADPGAVSNYRQSYRYDESGNLLELTHVGARNGRKLRAARFSNRCLPYRADVPPTEEEIAAAFDLRGNLRALEAGRSLTWNLRNQLQSVTPVERAGGRNDLEHYCYDGAGQRVRKTRLLQTNARGVVAQVRYLPGLELRSDTGNVEQLQVITVEGALNSVRVLHWQSAPPTGSNDHYRYTFTDHLGSTSLELGEDARVISQETFHPFGETAWSKDTEVSYKTLHYSGKERDATGCYYYGYRYYMPWLQRWLNPDPKGFIDGPNLYQMVGNSPMRHVDSDGGGKSDTSTSALADSAQKQKALLDSVTSAAADVRNSLLNHTQARHRFQALARRVGTQLISSAVSTGAQALGGAAGTALGGALGPGAAVLGGKLGTKLAGKAADAAIDKVVDTYQLNRPINFKGSELNPKAFVESVEPKKSLGLATVKLELAAHDPRTSDGRSRLVKMARAKVEDKVISVVADTLGSQTPGLIRTGREFIHASQGLNAGTLSDTYEHISANIDMVSFRTQAILTELATVGGSDTELLEAVSELSMQTFSTVQTLNRTQDFIGLISPTPYAGRQQSLGGSTRPKLTRQHSQG
ncbi:RHS repeat domain-containing protein [Pseudomonas sp. NPDC087639]|uniref:RHS repeat domain-containing protein n=1 Tax=Pseudomonas sp. NPDC087639 TaxID=3364445 RepID=UPI0037F19974